MTQKLIFSLSWLIAGYTSYAQPKRFEFVETKMASPFTIVFYHTDSLQAQQIATRAFHIVDSLAAIFTDYDPDSELNRFCASAADTANYHSISPALFDILLLSN